MILEENALELLSKPDANNVEIENINIDFTRNVLTIKGIRNWDSGLEEDGSFSSIETIDYLKLSTPFDSEVLLDSIRAHSECGNLHLELTKK